MRNKDGAGAPSHPFQRGEPRDADRRAHARPDRSARAYRRARRAAAPAIRSISVRGRADGAAELGDTFGIDLSRRIVALNVIMKLPQIAGILDEVSV